jgi:hypothetical protein
MARGVSREVESHYPNEIIFTLAQGVPFLHGKLARLGGFAGYVNHTTLATKKVTIYTEILLSWEYCVEQNLLPRAHLRGIFTGMAIIETANATLLKFWPR